MWRVAFVLLALSGVARAGVTAWRVSEVERAGQGGDPAVRFVELYSADGGCWFPSTQVAVFDGAGALLDAEAPFVETTCFEAGSFVLLATPEAQAAHGVDGIGLVPALPAAARQLCLRSTGTVVDCVRWGAVATPIHDLFGPDDDSRAHTPPPGFALARIADTDVIADDFVVATPTPGAPNDGAPWDPPPDGGVPDDAGVLDASPADDANVPDDGGVPDASDRPDARSDRFLDLDAQGAGCGCASGGGAAGWIAALPIVAGIRRRRRQY